MLYLGIIIIILGFIRVFFSKDLLISPTIKEKVKDKKGYSRFNGIMYIILGVVVLLSWVAGFYVSNDTIYIPGIIFCAIFALFQYQYNKRFFK